MGISGLLPFLADATDNIHIGKYAGKSVAIDTYCWIHRGAFGCADKLAKGEQTDVYVNYCKKYIKLLLGFKVKPILVFDGCRLPSKQRVEDERAERRRVNLAMGRQLLREGKTSLARSFFTKCVSVTSEMALQVMNMARDMSVDCIVAPYEADSQLAFFSKHDIVQAVITEDSDLLCFGCKRVIFKLDLAGNGREVELANLGRVNQLVGFTPDLFRHMCILSGCDYLPSIKGVGLTKACKALRLSKSKDSYKVARKLHQYIKGLPAVEPTYGAEFERADQTFLYQLVFDPRVRKLVPLTDYPQNLSPDDLPFAGYLKPDIEAFQIAIGNINVNNSKKIAHFNVDQWLSTLRTDGRLKSIWKSDKSSFKPTTSPQGTFLGNLKPKDIGEYIASRPHLIPRLNRKVPRTATPLTPEVVLKAVTEDIQSCSKEVVVENPKVVRQQNREDDNDLINLYTKKTKEEPGRVLMKSRFFSKKKLQKPIFPLSTKVKTEEIPAHSEDCEINYTRAEINNSKGATDKESYLPNRFATKNQIKRRVDDFPSCSPTKKMRPLPSSGGPFVCNKCSIDVHKDINDLFDVEDTENSNLHDIKDTKSLDVDKSSLHSDEGISVLDNITPPLQHVDLNTKALQKVDDVICISDEESEESCSLKPPKKTLGLSRNIRRKPIKGKSSKYFGKAKASGLKSKQPSMLNFLTKPKN